MHQCRPYCPDDFVNSIHRKHELVTKNLLEKHKQKMTLEGTASVVNPSWSFWVKPIWLQINKLKSRLIPKIQHWVDCLFVMIWFVVDVRAVVERKVVKILLVHILVVIIIHQLFELQKLLCFLLRMIAQPLVILEQESGL